MSRKYYTLLSKGLEDYHNGEWVIEYGSYVRGDCIDEQSHAASNAANAQERIKFKIITTGDTQSEINEAVAKLNA